MSTFEAAVAGVPLTQIVAVPTPKEFALFNKAGELFGLEVRLLSYVRDWGDERLDLWFRRGDPAAPMPDQSEFEAISGFRWTRRENESEVFGPWVQIINLEYKYFPITLIHELGHLVDRYHQAPQTCFSSATSSQFDELKLAYTQTRSFRQLRRIANGVFPVLLHPDGTKEEVFDLDQEERLKHSERAAGMLSSHEVFARCLTAYVIYRGEQNPDPEVKRKYDRLFRMFHARVADDRNAMFGADLTRDEFGHIEKPMQKLLQQLGWNNESNG